MKFGIVIFSLVFILSGQVVLAAGRTPFVDCLSVDQNEAYRVTISPNPQISLAKYIARIYGRTGNGQRLLESYEVLLKRPAKQLRFDDKAGGFFTLIVDVPSDYDQRRGLSDRGGRFAATGDGFHTKSKAICMVAGE